LPIIKPGHGGERSAGFAEIGVEANPTDEPPPPAYPDIEKLPTIAAKYGIEFPSLS